MAVGSNKHNNIFKDSTNSRWRHRTVARNWEPIKSREGFIQRNFRAEGSCFLSLDSVTVPILTILDFAYLVFCILDANRCGSINKCKIKAIGFSYGDDINRRLSIFGIRHKRRNTNAYWNSSSYLLNNVIGKKTFKWSSSAYFSSIFQDIVFDIHSNIYFSVQIKHNCSFTKK